jgi:hypothetical protein
MRQKFHFQVLVVKPRTESSLFLMGKSNLFIHFQFVVRSWMGAASNREYGTKLLPPFQFTSPPRIPRSYILPT